MSKIAVLYIAIGKYSVFWKAFHGSARARFLPGHDRRFFVFSDRPASEFPGSDVELIPQEDLCWPHNTLLRNRMFLRIKEQLLAHDYVFFCNANVLVDGAIGDEVLPTAQERWTVVDHPDYYSKKPDEFSYERNPESLAYIPYQQGRHYFTGGFNGGRAADFVHLCEVIDAWCTRDLERSIVPIWHDESFLNRFMLDQEPRVLDPSYFHPEGWNLPFPCRIRVLEKLNWIDVDALKGTRRDSFRHVLWRGLRRMLGRWWAAG